MALGNFKIRPVRKQNCPTWHPNDRDRPAFIRSGLEWTIS